MYELGCLCLMYNELAHLKRRIRYPILHLQLELGYPELFHLLSKEHYTIHLLDNIGDYPNTVELDLGMCNLREFLENSIQRHLAIQMKLNCQLRQLEIGE